MIFYKNAISPVVATALLLVVAVVAVVTFQSWFYTFSSNVFVDVEDRSGMGGGGNVVIESLVGETLYVKNEIYDGLNVTNLMIAGEVCVLDNLTLGMNEVNVSSCLSNVSVNNPTVVLITDGSVVEKQFYVESSYNGSSSINVEIVKLSYFDTVLADSPETYFILNDSNSVLVDYSGNNRNGGYSGSPTYQNDVSIANQSNDLVTYFSGNDYAYYNSLSSVLNPLGDEHSFEIWYKTASVYNTYNVLLSINDYGVSGTPANIFVFHLRSSSTILSPVIYDFDATVERLIYHNFVSTDNLWHHAVFTLNGTSSVGNLYLDGVEVGNLNNYPNIRFDLGDRFSIGQEFDGGSSPGDYFRGYLSNVASYGYILTPEQILEHYNSGSNN